MSIIGSWLPTGTHHPHATTPPVFVGRGRELRLLEGLIDSLPGGGTAAVITGEAGIGKTFLLEHLAARAQLPVHWVRAAESESAVPFAAAADLLLPLRRHFACLPDVQRFALESALALSDRPPGSPLAVCAAALGALAAAGDEQPQLIVVDDTGYLDAESRMILTFVARRLVAEHVVMLLTSRDPPHLSSLHPLPNLELAGLSGADCEQLADRLGIRMPRAVLNRIVRATGGNPLAVTETLKRSVRTPGLSGAPGNGPRIAVGASIRQQWVDVLASLPRPTWLALYVLAVDTGTEAPPVLQVLRALGLAPADLEPAGEQGLLEAGEPFRLRHPLLRQVLLQATPAAMRAVTYRALADLAPQDLRPWYLSFAAPGPDEDLAKDLEIAADRLRGQHGAAAALRLSRRAAWLSADPRGRARRLAAAAADEQLTGHSDRAVPACEEALRLTDDTALRTRSTLILAEALAHLGRLDQSYDALMNAGTLARCVDPAAACDLFAAAVLPASMNADLHRAGRAAREVEELMAAGVVPSMPARTYLAQARLLRGEVSRGVLELDAVHSVLRSRAVAAAQSSALVGQCWIWAEQFERARPLLDQAVDDARQQGATVALTSALAARSELELWTGSWAAGYADATEALTWATELDQVMLLGHSLVMLIRCELARGEWALMDERVDVLRRRLGPHAFGSLAVYLHCALGSAALARGEHATALTELEHAAQAALGGGMHNPDVVPLYGDLIEAHVRFGEPERARQWIDVAEQSARDTGLTYPALAAARGRGLLATTETEVRHAFDDVLDRDASHAMPFERARTLLCQGQALRRLRRRVAARSALGEAAEVFAALAAAPWLDRSVVELQATGVPSCATSITRTGLGDLTPQEMQIARLVASGRSNMEAAEALFVSRKTVEAHLTRVYRKLQVRSRTDLARILQAAGQLG